MTDGDYLLRAVIDEPDEDLHRLVYADWCDENGQIERAEFVRVQIELENGKKDGIEHADPRDLWDEMLDVEGCDCHFCTLREREAEILSTRRPAPNDNEHLADVWASLPEWSAVTHGKSPLWVYPLGKHTASGSDDFTFSRGFVNQLTCREEVWFSYGEFAVDGWPLERVFLKERQPHRSPGDSGCYFWEPGLNQPHRHQVPFKFAELGGWDVSWHGGIMVHEFESRDAALYALSDVLLYVVKPCKPAGVAG